MARTIGSWWIKDGIDGRRIEAQGFASLLDTISGFDWTEDHGDSGVVRKDFVETANYTEKVDNVDAVQMSSHGNPNGFSTWTRRTRTTAGSRRSSGCIISAASTPARTRAAARPRAASISRCTPPGCTR